VAEMLVARGARLVDADKLARVVVDPEERRRRILEQARGLAAEVGGELLEEEDLIQTLVFITEYPVAVRGTFHERRP